MHWLLELIAWEAVDRWIRNHTRTTIGIIIGLLLLGLLAMAYIL